MKKLIAILTLLTAFAAHSQDLQLQECTFGTTTMDFMPAPTLSVLMKKEVKGAFIYKVKYKLGQTTTGPKNDLAIIKKLPNKSLEVKFFEHDEQDGIVYKNFVVSIYLTRPSKVDRPVIIFNSSLYDGMPFKGHCSLNY